MCKVITSVVYFTIMMGTSLKDNNYYVFTKDEKDEFLTKEPGAAKYMHLYMQGKDFLYNRKRYVLWLIHANPSDLKDLPLVKERIKQVHDFRASKKSRDMQAFKDKPMFPVWLRYYSSKHSGPMLVIPLIATIYSYIPMEFESKNTIGGNQLFLLDNCNMFMFGILESKLHTIWAKALCGKLGKGLIYSNTMIYNNFPWPSPTSKQKTKIEAAAQAILDARKNYPDSSLADLYDPLLMPQDLRKAHEANDKEVLEAYGLKASASDNEIMAKLLKMYQDLVQNKD